MNGASLDRLIRGLRLAGFEFTAGDLADAFWLAPHLPAREDALESLTEATRPFSEPGSATRSSTEPPKPERSGESQGNKPPPPEPTKSDGVKSA